MKIKITIWQIITVATLLLILLWWINDKNKPTIVFQDISYNGQTFYNQQVYWYNNGVSETTLSDGTVLQFDDSTQKWVAV